MKHISKRLLCLLLSLVLVLSIASPAFAANGEDKATDPAVSWEKVSSGRAEPITPAVTKTAEPERDPKELVRISIVLTEESTLGKGYPARQIADNANAMSYRAALKAKQNALADKISREILNGEPLNVVWNITLAGNMISAWVPYGAIDAIQALDEVKTVVFEAQYTPDTAVEEEGDSPNMYRATLQTGTDKVWEAGITGAGARVAVIDTGVNHNHSSNSAEGLEYSYSLNAAAKGMTLEAYMASLNLLTAAEVAEKAEDLNVKIDPEQAYRSTKVPFAYNYVDGDYDVTHANDTQGNHGSHVAGIEAANKYVASGDGFVEAANGNNKIKGQAYDAQIINMKVFGKNGGAYDSDYMVAIEDAIVLGCDSANLSLGSSSAGHATSPEYQSILDSLANSDIVVSISMGNAYQWSYAAGVASRNIYSDDANYFTGGSPGSFANAFTVASVGSAAYNANGRYTMSSFSSWGVPSDLSLKPEITTPGGSIQSVNGTGNTGFTSMSGTSMAAPQAGGIAGLLGQFIRENDVLTAAKKTNPDITMRQLRQSLIMSTAVPIYRTNNGYTVYPILQQGAGMARVDKAVAAKTYVLIDPESVMPRAPLSAVSNVKDGKVKVELGDDPDYTGVYSTAFTLNNLTDEDVVYELSTEFFTQNITTSGANRIKAQTTIALDSNDVWTVDGKPIGELLPPGLYDLTGDELVNSLDAQAILDFVTGNIEAIPVNADKADLDGDGDVDSYDAHLLLQKLAEAQSATNLVAVPAGGKVKIGLTFDLKQSIEAYNDNGNYVEGYIRASEVVASGEGVDHSIPVLGYYGSWTDPSMFNKGSYLAYKYGGETRTPYLNSILGADTARSMQSFLVRYAGEEFGTPIGGNPVLDEDYYDENRNAIAPAFGDEIFSVAYSAIRNSGASRFRVSQEGVSEPLTEIVSGPAYGAYYNTNDRSWYNTNAIPDINYFVPETVPNNTKLTLSFELAPEYYVKADGSVDWDALHDGAKLSLPVTVDNEEPAIVDVSLATGEISGTQKLYVTAKDNQYIARFRILTEDGTVLLEQGSDRSAAAGDEYNVSFAITDATLTRYLVEVTDYALNVGTYRINLNKDELVDPEISITLDKTDFEIIGKNSTSITATVNPWGVADDVTWTTSDPAVATVNGRGVVTGVETGTATITATLVSDPTITASATVRVRFIEKTLNGVVCDENGAAYVIEFTMRDLPTYKTLHEAPLSDWVYETAVDKNGTVYVSTYDGSSQSPLYTLDLTSMELTQIGTGTSRTYYTDIEAVGDALYEQGLLVGVYNTNLYTINKATSARVATISMQNYTGTGSLVGISFKGTEDNVDHFYALTNAGLVFDVGLKLDGTNVVVDSAVQVLDFGYTADLNYWQDLYYDGENLYWSRIDLGISRVDLIMAEGFTNPDKETKILRAGSFAVDVWPVGGLFELSKVPGYTAPEEPDPEPETPADGFYLIGPDWTVSAIDAKNAFAPNPENASELMLSTTLAAGDKLKVVKVTDGAITGWYPDGSGNEYTVDEAHAGSVTIYFSESYKSDWAGFGGYIWINVNAPADPGSRAPVSAAPNGAAADKTIRITADEPTTNGEITVTFPETVTFVSAESPALKSVKAGEGQVVLAYAFENAVEKDSLVALLTFAEDSTGKVTVTTDKRNETKPEEEPIVVDFGGEAVNPEKPVYGEPEWTWTEDLSAATAKFTAENTGDVESLVAVITSEITKAATCLEAGEATYTATVTFGGKTYTDVKTAEIPATSHSYGEPAWTWNEDNTAATAAFTCAACGDVQKLEATVEVKTTAATCTEAGETVATAAVEFDGVSYSDVKVTAIEALGHQWDEGVVTTEASCTEAGVITYTCSRCGEKRTEAIDATGHTPEDVAEVPATCTEPGCTAGKKCAVCGAILEGMELILPTGHTVVIDAAVAATCTEPGLTAGAHCSVCNEVLAKQETVAALGHDAQVIPAVAPTCTEAGSTEGSVCARCGEILKAPETVAALGHDYVAAVTAPTCTEDGYTTYTCSRCGDSYTADIVPAAGHQFGEWTLTKEPGCTEAGEETRTCAVCGETETRPVNALGHMAELIPAVPATCTEPGTSVGVRCSICGQILIAPQPVEATGHAYGAPVWTWNEDLTAATATFTCEKGDDEQTIDAVITEEVTVEPTDKAEGEKTITATVEFGGETYTDVKTVVLDKTGHDCPCAAFTDMPEFGTTEHDAIDWAFTHDPQITNGTSTTAFSPDATVTRGQAVTFLWRAAGCPAPESSSNPFGDVKAGSYCYDAVLWAVEQGITNGTSTTTFSPGRPCQRAQIITFVYRFRGEPAVSADAENPFTDIKESNYYYNAVLWALENGIDAGTSETTFAPNADCTRAAVVTYLYRIFTGEGMLN